MRNILKATLVTAMTATFLAGASVAFAASGMSGVTGKNDMNNAPDTAQKNELIDNTTTGSITNGSNSNAVSKDCISQRLDAAGMCIVDKSM